MENEKSDFLSPSDPMIVVKELTKDVVQRAIEAYTEDQGRYLKLYAYAPALALDVETLDMVRDRGIAIAQQIEDSIDKNE